MIVLVSNHLHKSIYTTKGAEIGSMCMSLVATCEENNLNPLEYFVYLQKEGSKVEHHPERYLPWRVQAEDMDQTVSQEIFCQSPAIPA